MHPTCTCKRTEIQKSAHTHPYHAYTHILTQHTYSCTLTHSLTHHTAHSQHTHSRLHTRTQTRTFAHPIWSIPLVPSSLCIRSSMAHWTRPLWRMSCMRCWWPSPTSTVRTASTGTSRQPTFCWGPQVKEKGLRYVSKGCITVSSAARTASSGSRGGSCVAGLLLRKG